VNPRDLSTAQRIRVFIDEELLDEPQTGDPLSAEVLDSLGIEQLVLYIQEEFGVTLRDEEIVSKNFASVPALAELVDEKLSAARLSGA
jgi:acyl carrier protein